MEEDCPRRRAVAPPGEDEPLRPASGLIDLQPPVPLGTGGRRRRVLATPDWPAIKRDYATGDRSLRQLAVLHGCAHSTIANKAKRDGWQRLAGHG